MPDGLYRADPLSLAEREEFERDLIEFCDRALDLLGDISGLRVLYAGGAAPLWLEGLAERIGPAGSLTALEADAEKVEESSGRWLAEEEPSCPVSLVAGSVFSPPFAPGSFDLVYSAGLLHELDVSCNPARDVSRDPARDAIHALAATLVPGGRLVTEDFVDTHPAAQIEDEALEDDLRRTLIGEEAYGIGSAERLISLHQKELERVSWRELPPFGLRHLDRLVLAEEEPDRYAQLTAATRESLRERRIALRERVLREGYTRPVTLYVEGCGTS
jgi:SAM-dependent methyltransferase